MSKCYVYILLDPRKEGPFDYGEYTFPYMPFYVGKGTGNRWKAHINEARGKRSPSSSQKNPYKLNKIKKILTAGLSPQPYLISCESEEIAYAKEREVIKLIGLHNLTNIQPGGEGSGIGHKVADTSNMKLAQQARKEEKGKETKASWEDPEVAKSRKEGIVRAYEKKRDRGVKSIWLNNGEMSGKYEEARAQELLSQGWSRGRLPIASLQGRSLSEEHKQKMKDTAALPEKQKRRSENTKANWQREDYRQKRLESLQKTVQSRSLEKKIWVHRAEEKAFMVAEKDLESYVAQGYVVGRGKIAVRGKQGKSTWINNGIESKMLREDKALILLEQGWVRGRLALNKKHST